MARLKRYLERGRIEVGCDEAGRGCLSGPVVAAAVILPKGFRDPGIDDSKKLSMTMRERLAPIIMKKALAYGIGVVDHQEIDEINILNASFLAMHRALDQLMVKPDMILVDGNRFNAYPDITHTCIIKGDEKFLNIAAASVLAKTHRDKLMLDFNEKYPGYGWERNMGYPTKEHRQAIINIGVSPIHRLTFRLLKEEV
ncbi:MAG: ribonuclease HII [Patiriisocius sp.]|jgi:ribonuclease HII